MASTNPENPLPQESLSTDVIPVQARPQQTSSNQSEIEQNANQTVNTNSNIRTGPFGNILDPPLDWQFNVFLSKIEDGLSTEEFTKMKRLFEGEGGIGRGVLEKMKTPTDFFRILRTSGYISRDNLLYLQVILFWAGRKDLVKEAVEFSKTVGEVLHFYAPSYQPENGYKYVKFHIDGKDFQSYLRSDIENLRRRVSTLLCVPPHYVFIRGIEPSSSLVVTLMIPEMYVDILNNLLNEGEDFADLHRLGVDAIEVDGKTPFNIKGEGQDLKCNADQQAKFVNIYEQLKQTKDRLEKTEVNCLQLSHQLDLTQSKLNESEKNLEKSEIQVKNMTRILSLSGDESQPATLKEISSLKEFTESLHQINLESVDKRVIQRLIDATENVVATKLREGHRIQEQKMLLDLQDMQSKLVPLMYVLEKYKFVTNIGNVDESLLDAFIFLLLSMLVPARISETQISFTQHGLQIMKKISNKLRHKEKEKLKQKYQWDLDDKIGKFMEDKNMFLVGLLLKEIEEKQALVDAESFVATCLTEVNRGDLKKYLGQKPSPNTASQKCAAETRQQQEEQYGKKGGHPRQQQQVKPQGLPYQQQEDQADLITKMAQQVQEMYDMLQAKQEECATNYDLWKTPSFPFNPQSFEQNQAL